MSNIRPNPPVTYADAWYSNVGQSINQHNLYAGVGIDIAKTSHGTTISLNSDLDPYAMNYAGPWNFTSSYAINDVVYVDPLQSYNDQSGNPLPVCTGSSSNNQPPLNAGLFVCVRPVPPLGYDSTMLRSLVAPTMQAANQVVTSETADSFRWYSYNCYWPIYPIIPTSSLTTASVSVGSNSVDITANINYWAPLAPMIITQVCVNGALQTVYVNAVLSGSVFNNNLLPYQGS